MAFPLQFRDQFLLGLFFGLGSYRTKQRTISLLERRQSPIGERIGFCLPELPADFRRDILGVKFQRIEDESRGFHHIVTDAVTGHPRNLVFSHIIPPSPCQNYWRRNMHCPFRNIK